METNARKKKVLRENGENKKKKAQRMEIERKPERRVDSLLL